VEAHNNGYQTLGGNTNTLSWKRRRYNAARDNLLACVTKDGVQHNWQQQQQQQKQQ
jgi:hypothetical protein